MSEAGKGGSGISVVMATYNGAAHIREQLDSLAAQTCLPAELIITDDGSTDATLDIAADFARNAPFPVRIYRNPERLGYKGNFMRAVGLASGDLISFCDQDDFWKPDNLAKVRRAFADDSDVMMVFHNARLVDARRNDISTFYATAPMPAIARPLTLQPWSFSYGFMQTFRSVLKPAAALWPRMRDHYNPGKEMGHDLYFFLVASGLGSIAYLDEELAEYRIHGGNTVGSGKRTSPTFIDRWRYRLEDRADTYRYLARMTVQDSNLFADLAQDAALPEELRTRARAAAAAWRSLEPLYSARAEVCSASLPRRIAAFARLVRAGGYSERSFWTFGPRAMKKDAVLGVLLAPVVRRFGRESSRTDRACHRGSASTMASPQAVAA
ncbi:glycosyl transferase [Komagataeibacter rhaeticus]|uniref:Glycosyltransferase n=1 Tax=Komagataeibacter rhaeticus TaxID=215221 RepID=A0A858JEP7_9PROT|nr:glycosyltransferase [Komagataeibacter rhaeticus]ATU74220.1 glycosyl transferase [Komagataeibacter xylinus]EGG75201.1 Putative glycosyltransferase [Gluconacetobacter sp. SXCC-1]KDU96322.1 glycosyl transferase [Komagataeibacter rhaeticus AF1]MBL7239542.1 glycosyltransferase [Komagataeibacter rhaeticus]PYD53563.1 glycosyl transferase [Komagataeibacter rhaeticus]